VLGGPGQPRFGAGWHGIRDLVGPAAAGIRRVDQCLEVAAVHQDEPGGPAENLRGAVRVLPRHDVVRLTGQDVGRNIGGRQVDWSAQDRQRAGMRIEFSTATRIMAACRPAAIRMLSWFQYKMSNAGGAAPSR
jgi:hypothetical protein